jgi:hypothetical protein
MGVCASCCAGSSHSPCPASSPLSAVVDELFLLVRSPLPARPPQLKLASQTQYRRPFHTRPPPTTLSNTPASFLVFPSTLETPLPLPLLAVVPSFFKLSGGNSKYRDEPLLLDNEREAVADLLQYLESASLSPFSNSSLCPLLTPFRPTDRAETNFFTGDPLRALSTLSYSENVDLQRSAALAFAEITEKVRFPVPPSYVPTRSSLWPRVY